MTPRKKIEVKESEAPLDSKAIAALTHSAHAGRLPYRRRKLRDERCSFFSVIILSGGGRFSKAERH